VDKRCLSPGQHEKGSLCLGEGIADEINEVYGLEGKHLQTIAWFLYCIPAWDFFS